VAKSSSRRCTPKKIVLGSNFFGTVSCASVPIIFPVLARNFRRYWNWAKIHFYFLGALGARYYCIDTTICCSLSTLDKTPTFVAPAPKIFGFVQYDDATNPFAAS
jgi:hypothetical protein